MKTQEGIAAIEKEIRETPYHKATERHIGKLKARLAKLRGELYKQSSRGKSGGGGFSVPKTGDATVVLVGPPSVGKSTLVNALTGAKSKVAAYDFTTLKVIPGVLHFKGAKIQILDVPGLVSGAARGSGRGKEVLSVARIADLILLMTDLDSLGEFAKMEQELYQAGVRLNQKPPRVTISKRSRGGLVLNSPPLSHVSKISVKDIAREFGLVNAVVTIEEDLMIDRLIDALAGNRVYVRTLSIINKIDKARNSKLVISNLGKIIKISAREGVNLAKLKEVIWENLDLMRIYLRNKDGNVDVERPFILKRGATVWDAAGKLSTDLAEDIEGAKIWGSGAAYPGQRVGIDYRLQEEMAVTFLS